MWGIGGASLEVTEAESGPEAEVLVWEGKGQVRQALFVLFLPLCTVLGEGKAGKQNSGRLDSAPGDWCLLSVIRALHLLRPVFSMAVPGAFCQPGGSVLVCLPGLPGKVRMAGEDARALMS